MLIIRNLIYPLIFCCCLSVAHGQDVETDDSPSDQASAEQSQKEAQGSAQAVDQDGDAKTPSAQQKKREEEKQSEPKQQETKPVATKKKPPKDVFKPSEEISEDLPVPFPVDI